jgi:hypothetical protein
VMPKTWGIIVLMRLDFLSAYPLDSVSGPRFPINTSTFPQLTRISRVPSAMIELQ